MGHILKSAAIYLLYKDVVITIMGFIIAHGFYGEGSPTNTLTCPLSFQNDFF